MTPEDREAFARLLGEFPDDVQDVFRIRAAELGHASAADYLEFIILRDLSNPGALERFLKEHPQQPDGADFVKRYMEG